MEASLYGVSGQGVGYYAPRNMLFVCNKGTEGTADYVGTLDIYTISGSGASASATLFASLTGLESGSQFSEYTDGVIYQYADAERLFISDMDNDRILVYKYVLPTPTPAGFTASDRWTMYE
jgi:hypothetical protein